MAISLRAAGTATSATAAVTAVNPAVPTGTVAGDLSVLNVWVKPYNATVTTPAGWTKIGEHTNGTTVAGTDTGSMKVLVFVRESATVGAIGNLAQTSANSMGAVINSYQKAAGTTWNYSTWCKGGDAANGANYSATGDAGLSVATGDWVCQATAVNGDVGTLSAFAIAGMTGATLGTYVSQQNAAVTTGNDSRGVIGDIPITAGTSNVAPTFTYTNSSSTSGTTIWLRLREVVAAPVASFTTSATTITAGQTVTFTDTSTNTPTSWAWTFPGGTPASASTKGPHVVTFNTPGTYVVTLQATNAGGSNTTSPGTTITVNAAPTAVAKIWNGTQFRGTGIQVWNGTSWRTDAKVWNGTQWVPFG